VRQAAGDLPDPGVKAAVAPFGCQVEAGRYLPVDPPDAVRALMHEHLPTGIPVRVEEEPALAGKRQVCADVADQELVGERAPGKADVKQPPDGAARSVRSDQMAAPDARPH
jgi:hypothetical protein